MQREALDERRQRRPPRIAGKEHRLRRGRRRIERLEEAVDLAPAITDARFTVPMFGFVDSFNVSVSAALALYNVSTRRHARVSQGTDAEGDLSMEQLRDRADLYLRRALKSPELEKKLEGEGRLAPRALPR